MKELLELIAKSLVDEPQKVRVEVREEAENTILELHVAAEDMGKVIGRQGRIAKAIRAVIKAASSKTNKKVLVEIVQ